MPPPQVQTIPQEDLSVVMGRFHAWDALQKGVPPVVTTEAGDQVQELTYEEALALRQAAYPVRQPLPAGWLAGEMKQAEKGQVAAAAEGEGEGVGASRPAGEEGAEAAVVSAEETGPGLTGAAAGAAVVAAAKAVRPKARRPESAAGGGLKAAGPRSVTLKTRFAKGTGAEKKAVASALTQRTSAATKKAQARPAASRQGTAVAADGRRVSANHRPAVEEVTFRAALARSLGQRAGSETRAVTAAGRGLKTGAGQLSGGAAKKGTAAAAGSVVMRGAKAATTRGVSARGKQSLAKGTERAGTKLAGTKLAGAKLVGTKRAGAKPAVSSLKIAKAATTSEPKGTRSSKVSSRAAAAVASSDAKKRAVSRSGSAGKLGIAPRCISVNLRLSQPEHARMRAGAAEAGMNLASYIRESTFRSQAARDEEKQRQREQNAPRHIAHTPRQLAGAAPALPTAENVVLEAKEPGLFSRMREFWFGKRVEVMA